MKQLYFFYLATFVAGRSASRNTSLLPLDQWWGPNELYCRFNTSVRPTRIVFEDRAIADLRYRLLNHIPFTRPLIGAAFTYGFNTDIIEPLLEYWAKDYNFKAREDYLNQFPQFKTNIQGLDIHFVHVKLKSSSKPTYPIILLHGWPSTPRDFYETIPELVAASRRRGFDVEIVVPYLPGYGYSEATRRMGLGPAEIAVMVRNLMRRLGHRTFFVHGGDWGAIVGAMMATLFPKEVRGLHCTMAYLTTVEALSSYVLGSVYPDLVATRAEQRRIYPLKEKMLVALQETGYFHLQATKPDSLGVALTDSPSGLLAYLIEKFSFGAAISNRNLPDGGLSASYEMNQLMDTVTIYWMSRSITSSMRLYAEAFNRRNRDIQEIPTTVPTWVTVPKEEPFFEPVTILRQKFRNLINMTLLNFGGHYFAMQEPRYLADDIVRAIEAFNALHRT